MFGGIFNWIVKKRILFVCACVLWRFLLQKILIKPRKKIEKIDESKRNCRKCWMSFVITIE